MKSKIKKKAMEIRQHFNATGGGPPLHRVLDPFEKKIADICGNFETVGDENIDEQGFGRPQLVKKISSDSISNDVDVLLSDESCVSLKIQPVKRRIFQNDDFETPQKRKKYDNDSCPKSTPKSYRSESNITTAIQLQYEQNELLKKLVILNQQQLERLDYLVDCMENFEQNK